MIWTKKERELIAILDDFIENSTQIEKLKDNDCHRLLEQILAVTKGEVAATRIYCQQLLNAKKTTKEIEKEKVVTNNTFSFQPSIQSVKSIESVKQPQQNLPQSKITNTKKFQPFWTLLFLLFSIITIFFTAKKSPHIASTKTFSSIAIICPANLTQAAQVGITNRDEILLKEAIADFKLLKEKQGNQMAMECEQIFGEAQFIYAINFLAAKGQQKQAVANLCAIAAEYYQNRELIPWFTRWSNTNSDFRQWLSQYKIENNCPVATYLE